jgi:myo-inositol catabolism protein IolS
MKYKKLGPTDIVVSVLGLGTWSFSGNKYWGAQDDQISISTVHAALDAGINFFDTAETYGEGRSESVLAQALVGRRDNTVVATKVTPRHLDAANLIAACEGSLRRLNTDRIDLYQIHWPNHDVHIDETVEAMQKLMTQGKIRSIGVCNFGIQDLSGILKITNCASNQLPYSLLWRGVENEIQPFCVKNGVGILCYSSLAQGLLTGRYATADEVPEGLASTRIFSKHRKNTDHNEVGCENEAFSAIEEIKQVTEEIGYSMATVSLSWLLQQSGVVAALVGAREPKEIQSNLPATDLVLPKETLERLKAATEVVKGHLGCNCDMWKVPSRMK